MLSHQRNTRTNKQNKHTQPAVACRSAVRGSGMPRPLHLGPFGSSDLPSSPAAVQCMDLECHDLCISVYLTKELPVDDPHPWAARAIPRSNAIQLGRRRTRHSTDAWTSSSGRLRQPFAPGRPAPASLGQFAQAEDRSPLNWTCWQRLKIHQPAFPVHRALTKFPRSVSRHFKNANRVVFFHGRPQ